jgi:DNA-binding NtrC family response regulator
MFEGLKVLLIDDDQSIRSSTAESLELAGLDVIAFSNAERAMAAVAEGFQGIVVSDVKLPGMDGLQLLQQLKARDAHLPVILITGHGDISMAVQAMRLGAYDFIEKPFPAELLIDVVRKAMENCALRMQVTQLRHEIATLKGLQVALLGSSKPMETVRRHVATLADTNADVLIFGETGTGKEVVARSLHEASRRHHAKFVALNCGGLPESLFESEIFGHEAGAFTGAAKRRVGKIEHANGGTLFLDEIETMPMALQTKFLRVLQDRKIERLGSNQEIAVDFRLVAATKSDLKVLGSQEKFRSDLYYRLNVAVIELPALRDRREDIPLLFEHFTAQAAVRFGRERPVIQREVLNRLMSHDWPGNVRELRNMAERFVLGLFEVDSPLDQSGGSGRLSLADQVDEFERELIKRELIRCKGRAQAAMDALGLPKKTFYAKCARHGIRPDALRANT